MHLEFTADEANLVQELLERAYGELRMEIARTDDFAYRQGLHTRERLLEGILAALRRQLSEAGPVLPP